MTQTKAIALTSNSMPDIPDAKSLAAVRLNKAVPHYKDLAQSKRITWLKEQILTLNMIRHQEVEDFQLEFDAKVLDEFIMDDQFVRDYCFPEIKDAFKRGLMGDYGDYYGITAESLYGFLRGYLMSEKKRKATKMVRETLAAKRQPTEELYGKFRIHAGNMLKENKV